MIPLAWNKRELTNPLIYVAGSSGQGFENINPQICCQALPLGNPCSIFATGIWKANCPCAAFMQQFYQSSQIILPILRSSSLLTSTALDVFKSGSTRFLHARFIDLKRKRFAKKLVLKILMLAFGIYNLKLHYVLMASFVGKVVLKSKTNNFKNKRKLDNSKSEYSE